MVNLSVKLENVATQISKLLELFEISAKALAEKNFKMGDEKGSQKIAEKLDTLLDQNKVIARGLTLMHELNPRQGMPQGQPEYQSSQPTQQRPSGRDGIDGYQKSIASEDPVPSQEKKFKMLPKG